MSIFKNQRVHKADGRVLPFVIDCDDMTDAELGIFAKMIIDRYPDFADVIHPNSHYGSVAPRLAKAICELRPAIPYEQAKYVLVVDDVVTTGASMEKCKQDHEASKPLAASPWGYVGVSIFSHGHSIPQWIHPIFAIGDFL